MKAARCCSTAFVLEMLEYDRRSGTSFARTTWLFVENRCQMKSAAEALGIHRNTLDYRIKAIERTFGIEVFDKQTADSILMSVSVLRYLHVHGILETPELSS